MMAVESPTRTPRFLLICVGIGLLGGFLSGLFGVGGGVLIVPLLVLLLNFDQRLAAGTSLAAIVPIASVGVISYAVHDSVAWLPALILAGGAVVGVQIGTWLLARLPQHVLRWGFVGFMVVVIVMLFIVIPSRDAGLPLTVLSVSGLIVLGLITGVLSGLLGVGGGVVVVPALIIVFGTSDLLAKGTSMLMMIPTALTGAVSNVRRRNVDLLAAGIIGVAACTTTALGAWIATLLDPFWANAVFALYLTYIAFQLGQRALRDRRAGR